MFQATPSLNAGGMEIGASDTFVKLLTATQFSLIAGAREEAELATKASPPVTTSRSRSDKTSVTVSGKLASRSPGKGTSSKVALKQADDLAADGKVRRYDPAETRLRVIEAAYYLFGARGYSNTGTADIAAQADVSEGSIFYHFGSKRALLVELGRLHGRKMVEAMQGAEALDQLTFEITLNRCFDFCEVNNVWEEVVHEGADCATSARKNLKQSPDAEPFFHATREIVVGWTKAHMDAVAVRYGASGPDTEIAASLIFALVGDALQQYFDPTVSDDHRRRIRSECVRFCTAAAVHPAIAVA